MPPCPAFFVNAIYPLNAFELGTHQSKEQCGLQRIIIGYYIHSLCLSSSTSNPLLVQIQTHLDGAAFGDKPVIVCSLAQEAFDPGQGFKGLV